MPSAKSSLADITVDAEKLLAATVANNSLLPNIDEQRLPLQAALSEFKEISFRQQNLTADRQKSTQDLRAVLAQVRDLTIQLRAAIRSKLGVRTEKLVEFNVQPLRKRTRSPKTPTPAPLPENPGEIPAP
jgi:hypothetical protein